MKKSILLLFSLVLTAVLPGTSVMAEPGFMRDVNTACNVGLVPWDPTVDPAVDTTVITVECSSCHNIYDFDEETAKMDQYEHEGACSFCTDNTSCSPVRPTRDELLEVAKTTTNSYFERLFREFSQHMKDTGMMSPDGTPNNPMVFAKVFPDCPEIAPLIGAEFSRDTGYLVRRVSNRTRNSRNMPDTWEASQLNKFEKWADEGKSRTPFDIHKPNSTPEKPVTMTTMEFEAHAITDGPDDTKYFRYMRSITLPGLDKLPCLKCHGTFDDLGLGVRDEIAKYYPYDMSLGYKAGDIRAAWTIKIPIIEGEDD